MRLINYSSVIVLFYYSFISCSQHHLDPWFPKLGNSAPEDHIMFRMASGASDVIYFPLQNSEMTEILFWSFTLMVMILYWFSDRVREAKRTLELTWIVVVPLLLGRQFCDLPQCHLRRTDEQPLGVIALAPPSTYGERPKKTFEVVF